MLFSHPRRCRLATDASSTGLRPCAILVINLSIWHKFLANRLSICSFDQKWWKLSESLRLLTRPNRSESNWKSGAIWNLEWQSLLHPTRKLTITCETHNASQFVCIELVSSVGNTWSIYVHYLESIAHMDYLIRMSDYGHYSTPYLQDFMVEFGGQMNLSPYLPVGDTLINYIFRLKTLFSTGMIETTQVSRNLPFCTLSSVRGGSCFCLSP